MGLYGANRENATGMRSSVDSQMFVLFVSRNIAGTMTTKATRMMRIKPKRSAMTPPAKVMKAPMVNRIDRAILPLAGVELRTVIQ